MVHCNNCTSDLNAWVDLFKEIRRELFGVDVDMNNLYGNTVQQGAGRRRGLRRSAGLQLFLRRAYDRV